MVNRFYIAREGGTPSGSDSDTDDDGEVDARSASAVESGEEEEEEEEEVEDGPSDEPGPSSGATPAKKKKISLSLAGLSCHVCGKRGHNAGFVGSVYVDCPNKPCYLCKKPGHTTMTCPYRLAPDHDCTPTAAGNHGVVANLLQRSQDSRQREVRLPLPEWQIDAAVLRLHNRRCTCVQFHPTRDNLVLSGDKHGQVAVWDHLKVYERTVWKPNEALTNNLAFLPGNDGMSCCSSSADGTLKVIDIETGIHREVLNMNPEGWTGNPSKWVMLYGMDVCRPRNLIAAGDTRGSVHFLDARTDARVASHALHKTGNKVNSACFSPADENLLVTGSNDWTARLCDIRMLSSSVPSSSDPKGKSAAGGPLQLARIEHPKVVNSAFFSPTTGRKLMTTCIDNRIRVWDYLLAVDKPPDREIVHSHDFNRYLTPFRAEWDPKDPSERLFVCGRYISEDFGGVALHPVDLFDASTGKLLDQLRDPNLTTISPVNKFHPRLDMLLSGSSSSLFAWRPVKKEDGTAVQRSSSFSRDAKDGALQGSADFVVYNAGDAEKKKRKVASAGAQPEAATKDPPTKGGKAVENGKPSEGGKGAKPASGKGKGKKGSDPDTEGSAKKSSGDKKKKK